MNQSIEQELNDLRSLIAQSASGDGRTKDAKLRAELLTRLEALEARVQEGAAAADPGAAARAKIVAALSAANDGKPGFLSAAQLEVKCNMTKSAIHTHVNELEKEGKVWIRKTHGDNGRPCFYIYHPKAVRA